MMSLTEMNVLTVHLYDPSMPYFCVFRQSNACETGQRKLTAKEHFCFIITAFYDVSFPLSFLLWLRMVMECIFYSLHNEREPKKVANCKVIICSASIEYIHSIYIILFSWWQRLIVCFLISYSNLNISNVTWIHKNEKKYKNNKYIPHRWLCCFHFHFTVSTIILTLLLLSLRHNLMCDFIRFGDNDREKHKRFFLSTRSPGRVNIFLTSFLVMPSLHSGHV